MLRQRGRIGSTLEDVLDRKSSPDVVNAFDGTLAKRPLQRAGDQVYHDRISHLPKHTRQLTENLHRVFVCYELRFLRNRGALLLDVLSELGSELEDRMIANVVWDIVVPFDLVSNMEETVVYSDLQFVRRLIFASLFLVVLLECL